MPPVDRQLESTPLRPRVGRAAVLGLAVLLGPFLPGSFLAAGPDGRAVAYSEGVVPAAAGELVSRFGEPTTRCTVSDPRLPEISGLAPLGEGLLAINDGGEAVIIHELDADCAIVGERRASVDPYDPEDLAVAADGTVWLADTGDNRLGRETVAVIAVRPDGTTDVHRLRYPDGAHDAEALLLAPDGTPYLVTKEVLGVSGIYRPTVALDPADTVPMERVGELALQLTGSPGGPVGRAGQLLVTGGAVSPDGTAIALRTYTDAYVWSLTGSDVVGSLAGEPVRVALPDSPQGEAIAFDAAGRSLLVSGEGLPVDVTEVPIEGASVPAASAGQTDSRVDLQVAAGEALTPWTVGMIATATAAVLVWAVGRTRRRE